MKKSNNLTEVEFNQVKQLTDKGVNKKLIEQLTGRSQGTVWRISVSETFEAYKESVREAMKPKQAVDVVPAVDEAIGNNVHARIDAILETLEEHATRLKWIESNAVIETRKRKFWN